MNDLQQAEYAILERHEPNWIAQGYKVVRNPDARELPAFFKGYVPDAVLLGRSPKVVVEIISKGSAAGQKRISDLKMLMQGHDDWNLEVLFAGRESEMLPLMSAEAVQHSLEHIRKLLPSEPKSALLLCWATLEAIARLLEPTKAMRPQSAGGVVELLAGAGHVTPGEASRLRSAVQWRNRLMHGDLSVSLTPAQVTDVVEIAEGLINALPATN